MAKASLAPKPEVTDNVTALVEEVKDNLYRQLEISQEMFDSVNELGNLVQDSQVNEEVRTAIEQVMRRLFRTGKSLSDGAYQTGKRIKDLAHG